MKHHIILLVGLALAACGEKAPPAPPPPGVSVALPLERKIIDWDDYVGRFVAPKDVEVRARVTGIVSKVLFHDGQDVREGQPLFVIDPRPYAAALAQAQAQVGRSQATLANARTELTRAEKLVAAQAFSREEFETRSAALKTAQADLAAARAAAEARALDLSFTTVRAPFAGRVSDRRINVGGAVTLNDTVLTRVVSLDPIWFSFEGAESFYLKYLRQAGDGERGSSRNTPNPVEVQLADEPGYRWKGRMEFVDNAIDPSSGTIRAYAVIANPRRFLTPGMFGRARLLGSGSYQALLIPDEAITTDQARRLVYVLGKDNKVVSHAIETGPLVEGLRVVRKGLNAKDLVVLDGLAQMRPDTQVTPKKVVLKPRAPSDPSTEQLKTPQPAEATAAP